MLAAHSRTVTRLPHPGVVRTRWLRARALLVCIAALSCGAHAAALADASGGHWDGMRPDRAFGQSGTAPGVRTLTFGLIWEGHALARPFGARLSYYTELSLARWRVDRVADGSRGSHTKLGLTPVLRLSPSKNIWFAELGVGVHMITPTYRNRDKRFSTAFNFGDVLGVGISPTRWGGAELALRLQHYSNAGIRHPNPGENFLQLQFSMPL